MSQILKLGNNFSQSREYVEPSLPEHLLIHQNNSQSQQPEYVEPYFSETKHSCYQTSTLNGAQLSQQDDQESNSDNSYAALNDQSLDDVSDSENSILKREEGEIFPTPPKLRGCRKPSQLCTLKSWQVTFCIILLNILNCQLVYLKFLTFHFIISPMSNSLWTDTS